MLKFLILTILVWCVFRGLDLLLQTLRGSLTGASQGRQQPVPGRSTSPKSAQAKSAGQLIPCSRCGVHVPQSSAVSRAPKGSVYCSEECRLADA